MTENETKQIDSGVANSVYGTARQESAAARRLPTSSRNQLIVLLEPLLNDIASSVATGCGAEHLADELSSCGRLALVESVDEIVALAEPVKNVVGAVHSRLWYALQSAANKQESFGPVYWTLCRDDRLRQLTGDAKHRPVREYVDLVEELCDTFKPIEPAVESLESLHEIYACCETRLERLVVVERSRGQVLANVAESLGISLPTAQRSLRRVEQLYESRQANYRQAARMADDGWYVDSDGRCVRNLAIVSPLSGESRWRLVGHESYLAIGA